MTLLDAFSKNTELCLDGRITDKSSYPVGAGGHADIYQGSFGSEPVAIKVLRPYASSGRKLEREKLLRRLWREYLAWSNLSHPNILGCLGYSYDFFPGSYILPSLVSPWMENGTVASYLEFNPDADRVDLLIGIVEGLVYLHTRKPAIIHGDLRAGNVLVSDQGVPCLTDFGLSRIVDEEVKGMTTSSELAGSVRWMAPELFQGEGTINQQSDVWAIGMTTLEILSERVPYYTVKSDLIVLSQIRDGRIPSRPGDPRAFELLDDSMWDICQRCWTLEPAARPSMEDVLLMMTWVYAPVFLPL